MIKWQNKRLILSDKFIAYAIGTGLAIGVIHHPQEPWLAYGMLAQFGFLISLIMVGFCLANLPKGEKLSLGNKAVWIPLAIIAVTIVARPIYALITGDSAWGMGAEWAGAAYALYLFAFYLVARRLGTDVLKPFTAGVIIASIGCIAYGLVYQGVKTGGIISPTNYDMAAGFLCFGVLVSSLQSRWWLSAVALVGLFFTGADEALFIVGVLGLVILIRRDLSKKLSLPAVTLAITVVICTPLGITQSLYFPAVEKVAATKEAVEDTRVGHALDKIVPDAITNPISNFLTPKAKATSERTESKGEILDEATNQRWLTYWRIPEIKPLGYGYNINFMYRGIPHNVPLIIVHQIGIIPALAWLWVTGYCFIKTKWKYAWAGVMAMCVFDHYIWTMAAPWWWALVGVSTASNIERDYIFKRTEDAT